MFHALFLVPPLRGRPPNFAHCDSSLLECFLARINPPRRAQVRLSSGVVLRARAAPPNLPSATAWGFFDIIVSYIALSTFVKKEVIISIGPVLCGQSCDTRMDNVGNLVRWDSGLHGAGTLKCLRRSSVATLRTANWWLCALQLLSISIREPYPPVGLGCRRAFCGSINVIR